MTQVARTAKDVVRVAFDALNDRDRDTFIDLHAEDAVMHSSDGQIRGVEAITDDGDLAGIEPTGQQVDFEVMGLFRVKDALATEVWVLPDRLELMRQLGIVEAPPV